MPELGLHASEQALFGWLVAQADPYTATLRTNAPRLAQELNWSIETVRSSQQRLRAVGYILYPSDKSNGLKNYFIPRFVLAGPAPKQITRSFWELLELVASGRVKYPSRKELAGCKTDEECLLNPHSIAIQNEAVLCTVPGTVPRTVRGTVRSSLVSTAQNRCAKLESGLITWISIHASSGTAEIPGVLSKSVEKDPLSLFAENKALFSIAPPIPAQCAAQCGGGQAILDFDCSLKHLKEIKNLFAHA
jgi:hypothetical protein